MSYCFLIESDNDKIMHIIHDFINKKIVSKRRQTIQSYCYNIGNHKINALSYGCSNQWLNTKIEHNTLKIFLSDYATMIFAYLLKQEIKFSFCVIDLKNKEDEESVLNKIDIKNFKRYQLGSQSVIDERWFYIINNNINTNR